MAKSIQPAITAGTTDAAVRWLIGVLLIVVFGFGTSALLDFATAPTQEPVISQGR